MSWLFPKSIYFKLLSGVVYLFHLQTGKTKLPIKQKQPWEYLRLEGGNGHRRNGKNEKDSIPQKNHFKCSVIWLPLDGLCTPRRDVPDLPRTFLQHPSGHVKLHRKNHGMSGFLGLPPSPVDRRCLQGALENTNTNEKATVWKWEWKIPNLLTVQHAAFQQLLRKFSKTSTSHAAPRT